MTAQIVEFLQAIGAYAWIGYAIAVYIGVEVLFKIIDRS